MVRWVKSLVVAVTLVPHAAHGGREEALLWLGGLKCGNAASTDRALVDLAAERIADFRTFTTD